MISHWIYVKSICSCKCFWMSA
uniref:Uncharacterized protein n=1 Tax=Arundo donax TaxID=35708 RepID=A0A0A9EG03_ARUDO